MNQIDLMNLSFQVSTIVDLPRIGNIDASPAPKHKEQQKLYLQVDAL